MTTHERADNEFVLPGKTSCPSDRREKREEEDLQNKKTIRKTEPRGKESAR